MKAITKVEVSKARRAMATYIRLARQGRTVILTRHGRSQAKLTRPDYPDAEPDPDADIAAFFTMRCKRKADGVAVVNALRARRRSSSCA